MINDYQRGMAEMTMYLAEQMRDMNNKLENISDGVMEMNPNAGKIQFEENAQITDEQFKFDFEEDFG